MMHEGTVSETIKVFFDAYLVRRNVRDSLYSLCLSYYRASVLSQEHSEEISCLARISA